MQTDSESSPENLGAARVLERRPLNAEAIEKFAQNMAENLMKSFLGQTVEPEESRSFPDQEMFAEDLGSAVMEAALREVCGGRMDREKGKNLSSVDQLDKEKDVLGVETHMDPVKEVRASRSNQPHHPPLSQSGLPPVGSLDYPDAPPTTPLLPELERSRHSFARKLKGGLAKVFLPSPPPPTPKEEKDAGCSITDPQVEFMEHLMHSLSTDDVTRDTFEGGSQRGASMEAFAEALSCDVIDWALSAKNREELPDDNNLHLLANKLAESIITSSFDEAKTLF